MGSGSLDSRNFSEALRQEASRICIIRPQTAVPASLLNADLSSLQKEHSAKCSTNSCLTSNSVYTVERTPSSEEHTILVLPPDHSPRYEIESTSPPSDWCCMSQNAAPACRITDTLTLPLMRTVVLFS